MFYNESNKEKREREQRNRKLQESENCYTAVQKERGAVIEREQVKENL